MLPGPLSLSNFEPQDVDKRVFFRLGLKLVDTEGDSAVQYVITELATQRGLRMVKAIIDRLEGCIHGWEFGKTFLEMVLPLFQILTHPNVRPSLLLETPLHIILNWLFGPHGQRLIAILRSATITLVHLQLDDSGSTSRRFTEALTATLSLLYAICELHLTAQVLEELAPILETLADYMPASYLYYGVRQSLTKIMRRLRLGAAISIAPPVCKHKIPTSCDNLPLSDSFSCTASCGALLSCGHECKRKCKDCNVIEDGKLLQVSHGKCLTICGQNYTTCHHSCKRTCHDGQPCPLCEEPCEVQCAHSRCGKSCSEPCAPCAEDCSWACPHRGKCQMACAVPCDLLPCSRRCEKILSCSHRCPSVCGESCPSARYCQECAHESIKELVVDYIMQSTYAEIDLEVNPVLVPPCGHLLTMESMDGHMQMSAFFELSSTNPIDIVGLKNASKPFAAGDLKGCPLCRQPLRGINRYGRIVRCAFIDEATKKFIVWANSTLSSLELQLAAVVEKLAATEGEYETVARPRRGRFRKMSVPLKGDPRYQIARVKAFIGKQQQCADLFRIRQLIRDFHKKVDVSEQPFSRIYDLAQDARFRRGVLTDFDRKPEILQTRSQFLATTLWLRCDYNILLEFCNICKNGQAPQTLGCVIDLDVDFTYYRRICYTLIAECEEKEHWWSVVEGEVLWAYFTALECCVTKRSELIAELLTEARKNVKNAQWACQVYPGQTTGLLAEVDYVEDMLNGVASYVPVTTEERAAIYAAMASVV